MSGERTIKRIEGPDGKLWLEIMARDDGLFRFVETNELTEDGYTFRTPTHWSGVYEDAEAAELDARAILPWLRDQISN